MAEGAAGSGKKIRNLSWAETWLQNEYPERHVTQGSQNSNPAGICFPLWINYVTWRECPAGNLSRGFQLQVEGTAWENKPKYETLLCFQLQVWRYLGSPQPLTWIVLAFWLASELDTRQCFYPKGEALLSVILASLKSSCCVPHTLQNSKSTALTPKHLLGRYWFFLLSISSPDSNKEVKNQGKYKNQSALLWIHTWDSPSLKWDVFVHIWSHNEILQLLWDELALQSFKSRASFGCKPSNYPNTKFVLLWLITQLESC